MDNSSNSLSDTEIFAEPRYLLAEKQLASIPLWQPKKKGGKDSSRVKVVSFRHIVQEKPVEITLKVLAGGDYGFPNTTDLEFFRAFEQIVTERILQQGTLHNPICVTGREMLEGVNRVPGGSGYVELRRFFSKMHALSFEVERTQGNRYKTGRFHIFNSMYQEGEKKDDGSIAEVNEIELASWYLKGLQTGNCLVIDHVLFQRLGLSLSKLLHQFLHAQFHFHRGVALGWYDEIANNWQMKEYSSLSRIKQQMDPSHKELKRLGFLESWEYIPFKRKGKKAYQISWKAGPQWWEIDRVQKNEIGPGTIQSEEHLLYLGGPEDDKADEGKEGVLHVVLEFVGASDRKYLPFWKQATRDLSSGIVYKMMGEIRERIQRGESIRNKGSYLLTLMKVEGKKRGLAWAVKS